MDVMKAVETYVNKLVSTPSAMKVLLLDSHTVRIKSLVWNVRGILAPFRLDAYSVPCFDTVLFALVSSLPNGSNRQ
jgi:hypothetical protein